MGFLQRFGNGPLMGSPRTLPTPPSIQKATYQIITSEHGLPMVQLGLQFPAYGDATTNPEMSLLLLIDRSGSMQETYDEGHVYNVAEAVLSYLPANGAGLDLVFYDDRMSDAGHITSMADLDNAIRANPPRGGTYLAKTLRASIERYRRKRGIYAIVITDGEFADKGEVQQYIVDSLLPQLTPQNPYAFRLHFVGAGHGVDHEFLQQLELAAGGQGIQLVKHHHHAHLRHSHTDIQQELEGAYIGIAESVVLGQRADGGPVAVSRVGNVAARVWRDGNLQDIGFVPRRALLGLEYAEPYPPALDVVLRYSSGLQGTREIDLKVPMPRATASSAAPPPIAATRPRFQLPWRHRSPEEEAARQAAAEQQAALAQRIQEDRAAEQQRQTTDLQILGRGGIPSMAQQRLKELREATMETSFTSDLSPDEAALLRRNGYRPVGLVSGSAMYHVGVAYASSYQDCEVDVLSGAYTEATRLAVGRMEQEAQALGAHGVIGVRFDIVRHEWGDKTIEVQLLGTAVAGPDRPSGRPFLSDLSGQEWWALHRAGYDPAGLVYGHCTWFVLTSQSDEWTERSFVNQELDHMSRALSQCRSRANGAVREMARQAGAIGVVGVHLSRRVDEIRLSGPGENPAYEREHHNLTMSIIGTAVRLRPDAPRTVRATTNVLSLRSGKLTPHTVTTAAATFE